MIDLFDENTFKYNCEENVYDTLIIETTDFLCKRLEITSYTCQIKNKLTYLNDKFLLYINQNDFNKVINYITNETKTSNAQKVYKFASEAGDILPKTPVVMNMEEIKFICQMVISELTELAQTVLNKEEVLDFMHKCIGKDFNDQYKKPVNNHEIIAEQADALVDAIYYIYHTAATKGINLDKLFDIVHEANMNKKFPDGTFHKRESDGKIIKPPNWQSPNITAGIADQFKFNSF